DAAAQEGHDLVVRPAADPRRLVRGDVRHLLIVRPLGVAGEGKIVLEPACQVARRMAFPAVGERAHQISAAVPGRALMRIRLEWSRREVEPAPEGLEPAP